MPEIYCFWVIGPRASLQLDGLSATPRLQFTGLLAGGDVALKLVDC